MRGYEHDWSANNNAAAGLSSYGPDKDRSSTAIIVTRLLDDLFDLVLDPCGLYQCVLELYAALTLDITLFDCCHCVESC
jgi:hypothetical protein